MPTRDIFIVLAMTMLVGCTPTAPQQVGLAAGPPYKNGHFYRNGPGFNCVTTEKEPPNDGFVCARIGPLRGGVAYRELTGRLGTADQQLPRTDGAIDYVHFLSREVFVVATVEKDKVIRLQLTGRKGPPDWTFSDIALGTTEAALRARLGEPMRITPFPPEGTGLWSDGGVRWSYEPWSFSFELVKGVVISIAVGAG